MPLRAVFFDLDGTLLDTSTDMNLALNRILEQDGLPTLTVNQTRSEVSNGSLALVKKGYRIGNEDERLSLLRSRFLKAYKTHICEYTTPFDGIEELLENLSRNNLAWGIVTNKPWAYTEPLMKNFSFADNAACIVCPDHVSKSKPDPESLSLACEAARCTPEQAIYVGDHLRDIQCGKNAGMRTIAAAYGFIDDSENIEEWRADYCVKSAEEIWPLIKNHI